MGKLKFETEVKFDEDDNNFILLLCKTIKNASSVTNFELMPLETDCISCRNALCWIKPFSLHPIVPGQGNLTLPDSCKTEQVAGCEGKSARKVR